MPKFLDIPTWYEDDASYNNRLKTQNGKFKRNVFTSLPESFSVSEGPSSSFSLTAAQVGEGGQFEGITTGDYIMDYSGQMLYIVTAVAYLSGGSTYYISIQVVKRHLYAVKFTVMTYTSYVCTYIWSNKYYTQTTMTSTDLCNLLFNQGEEFPATGYSSSPYVSMALIYSIKPSSATQGIVSSLLIDKGESTASNRFYNINYSNGLITIQSVKQLI